MTGLFRSPLFEQIKRYFEQHNSEDKTIFLFVPYIKTVVLEKLLDEVKNQIVVLTTWKPNDILMGSSDIELYPFCKERKIALYISEKLHLKFYSVGLNTGILATGNVSHNGLLPNGNYEIATMLESLTIKDRLFFENIQKDARLVNDTMYEQMKEWVDENKIVRPKSLQLQFKDIIPLTKKDDFLISALPMTRSVNDLITGYKKITLDEMPSNDSEIAACTFHDLVNYDMPMDLSEQKFIEELSTKFFVHPFIQKIDEFISPEAYFGRMKEWIQNNCTDVPVPSRRDLTGNVQVLLEWFEKLGNGKYVIDVPGARSQRIYKNYV